MSMARDHRDRSLESLTRKLLAAMILTGGLLTAASFAKHIDHGALVADIVRLVENLTAR